MSPIFRSQREEMLPAPDGRSLVWIFDHCLRYPTTYEIPLRHMYSINHHNAYKKPRPVSGSSSKQNNHRHSNSAGSARSAESSQSAHSTNSNVNSHTTTPRSSTDMDEIDGADDFNAMMEKHIARLPSQPCTMPFRFLLNFLRGCFVSDGDEVEFLQALTAMDYLRDLHLQWKKEFSSALAALGITKTHLEELDNGQLAAKFPTSIGWLWDMSSKTRDLEAMYGQLYIEMRRWTLINEMLLDPKSRPNHLALLNTLFPPIMDTAALPEKVTPRFLQITRDGYFKWIDLVHKKCADITNLNDARRRAWETLKPIFADQAPLGEKTTWSLTFPTIHKYLNLADDVAAGCQAITLSRAPIPDEQDPSRLSRGSQPAEAQAPNDALAEFHFSDDATPSGESQRSKTRKADSGISFGSTSAGNCDKPLPDFPVIQYKPRKVSGLERLAGELKRMGFNKPKGLKKMKSSSALNFRSASQMSYTDSNFEVDDEMRARLIEQARQRKGSNASSAGSAEPSAAAM